jgi:hypothetical protein
MLRDRRLNRYVPHDGAVPLPQGGELRRPSHERPPPGRHQFGGNAFARWSYCFADRLASYLTSFWRSGGYANATLLINVNNERCHIKGAKPEITNDVTATFTFVHR